MNEEFFKGFNAGLKKEAFLKHIIEPLKWAGRRIGNLGVHSVDTPMSVLKKQFGGAHKDVARIGGKFSTQKEVAERLASVKSQGYLGKAEKFLDTPKGKKFLESKKAKEAFKKFTDSPTDKLPGLPKDLNKQEFLEGFSRKAGEANIEGLLRKLEKGKSIKGLEKTKSGYTYEAPGTKEVRGVKGMIQQLGKKKAHKKAWEELTTPATNLFWESGGPVPADAGWFHKGFRKIVDPLNPKLPNWVPQGVRRPLGAIQKDLGVPMIGLGLLGSESYEDVRDEAAVTLPATLISSYLMRLGGGGGSGFRVLPMLASYAVPHEILSKNPMIHRPAGLTGVQIDQMAEYYGMRPDQLRKYLAEQGM